MISTSQLFDLAAFPADLGVVRVRPSYLCARVQAGISDLREADT